MCIAAFNPGHICSLILSVDSSSIVDPVVKSFNLDFREDGDGHDRTEK